MTRFATLTPALLLAAGLGCSNVDVPTGPLITCDVDDDCPNGVPCSAEGFCAAAETTPPGPVSDLAVDESATTDTSITVVFTAPGDDGVAPGTRAVAYRARVAAAGAEPVERDLDVAPSPALTRERIVVDGLERGAAYALAIVSVDDVGNASVSNVVTAETGGALCPPDPETGRLVAVGSFRATSAGQLVRLSGCQEIDGALAIVDDDCAIARLDALGALERVSGRLELDANALCGVRDVDELAALVEVGELRTTSQAGIGRVALTALAAAARVEIGGTPFLTDVSLPALASVAADLVVAGGAPGALAVDLSALTTIGGAFTVVGTSSLAVPALQTIGGSLTVINSALAVLALPATTAIGGALAVSSNPDLVAVSAPLLATVATSIGFTNNDALVAIDGLPALATFSTFSITGNAALTTLDLPALTSGGSLTVQGAPAFTTFDLPALTGLDALFVIGSPSLTTLDGMDALDHVGPPAIQEQCSLQSGGLLLDGLDGLTTVELPAVTEIGAFILTNNPALDTLALPALAQVKRLSESANPALDATRVDELRALAICP